MNGQNKDEELFLLERGWTYVSGSKIDARDLSDNFIYLREDEQVPSVSCKYWENATRDLQFEDINDALKQEGYVKKVKGSLEATEKRNFVIQNKVAYILNNALKRSKTLIDGTARELLRTELQFFFNKVEIIGKGVIHCTDLKEKYMHNSSAISRDRDIYIKYNTEVHLSEIGEYLDTVNNFHSNGAYPIKIICGYNVSSAAKELCRTQMIAVIAFDGKEYAKYWW